MPAPKKVSTLLSAAYTRAVIPTMVWALCRLTVLDAQREETMMKTRWLAFSLISLVITGAAAAQQSVPREKRRYIVAPRELYLLVSASQPDCPLRIEGAKLLLDVDRGWGISCRLHNQGSKPI